MSRLKMTGVSIDVMVRRDLAPAARQKIIADVARQGLAESQEINRRALGRVPEHETFVDGRKGAALESVNPDRGTIAFTFTLLGDMFGWIDLQLIRHSPALTGQYRRSHVLLADGASVDPDNPPAAAREYAYVNTLAYARKIEGVGERKPQSSQAPEGVYDVVAALASARFGNLAKIHFAYRALTGAAKGVSRQPAIIVVPR